MVNYCQRAEKSGEPRRPFEVAGALAEVLVCRNDKVESIGLNDRYAATGDDGSLLKFNKLEANSLFSSSTSIGWS